MPNEAVLLEMRGICKAFPGVQALNGINFSVKAGKIHALMGENGAGKSTLMKCLFGIYKKDAGEILIEGKPVDFANTRQALDGGVSMVHQELNQVQGLSIMENVWLGRFPTSAGLMVDWGKMYRDTLALFDDLGIQMDPKERISRLSVSECQMIEIAKAVSCSAKIIVLDEPTSSLTEREVEHLFQILNKLTQRGCGVVYISHKMEEILRISDYVTVMRDGTLIGTKAAEELTVDEIIRMMVGRELTDRFPARDGRPSEEVVLQVEHLTGYYQPSCQDVSFELHKGEILGIAGLVGARRTEIVETIFGIRRFGSGTILKDGKPLLRHSPQGAIRNGFALITEERRKTGIFAGLSVSFNTVVVSLRSFCGRLGVLSSGKIKQATDGVIQRMNVKTPSPQTRISALSGGNQQKVIIGRWLLGSPQILMMDEPTRGIDVGSKYEIYQQINRLADNGCSIIFISSEMPELLGVSDRILVMSNGRVAGMVDSKTTDQEEIMRLCAKYV